eukprot:s4095_g3.t4
MDDSSFEQILVLIIPKLVPNSSLQLRLPMHNWSPPDKSSIFIRLCDGDVRLFREFFEHAQMTCLRTLALEQSGGCLIRGLLTRDPKRISKTKGASILQALVCDVGKSFWVVSKNVHLLQRVKHTRWRKRDPQVRKQWESLPIVEAEEVCCAVSEDP